MDEIFDDFSCQGRNPFLDLIDRRLDSICSSGAQQMVSQIVHDVADKAVNRAIKENQNQANVIVGQILDDILMEVVQRQKDSEEEDSEDDQLLIINVESIRSQSDGLAEAQGLGENNVDSEMGEVATTSDAIDPLAMDQPDDLDTGDFVLSDEVNFTSSEINLNDQTETPDPTPTVQKIMPSLRLRNFAIDPAQSSFTEPTLTAQEITTSWHTTQVEEKTTRFAEAMEAIQYRYVMIGDNGCRQHYAVVSSSRGLFFKVFIHETLLSGLSSSQEGWEDVAYHFLPVEGHPKEVIFTFKNHMNVSLKAKLPVSDNDFTKAISNGEPFVLSTVRLYKINKTLEDKMNKSFIRYAFKAGEATPMAVDIKENAFKVVPIFGHLTDSVNLNDQEVRDKTVEHLRYYTQYHGISIDVKELEKKIFSYSVGEVRKYINLLCISPPSNLTSLLHGKLVTVYGVTPVQNKKPTVAKAVHNPRPAFNLGPPKVVFQRPPTTTPAASQKVTLHSASSSQSTSFHQPVMPSHPPTTVTLTRNKPEVITIMNPSTQCDTTTSQPRIVSVTSAVTNMLSSSVQKTCPFCPMVLPSLRSKEMFDHVGIYHLPHQNKKQACDVPGCNAEFSSRQDHIAHISEHTLGNDNTFVSGLAKLKEYFGNPKVLDSFYVLAKLDKVNKPTACNYCRAPAKSVRQGFEHLTQFHFENEIAKNIEHNVQIGLYYCRFAGCQVQLSNKYAMINHMGVQHEIALALMKCGLEKSGPVYECPLVQCSNKNIYGLKNLALHLIFCHDMVRSAIQFEIASLNRIFSKPMGVCPVENCRFTLPSVSSFTENYLTCHYGVVHGAVFDLILSLEEIEIKNSQEGNIRNLLEEERKKSQFWSCKLCQRNKPPRFCNEAAYLSHLTTEHFSLALKTEFMVKLLKPGTMGVCVICQRVVATGDRALHAGVVHKMALDKLAKENEKQNSNQVSNERQESNASESKNQESIPSKKNSENSGAGKSSNETFFFKCPECSWTSQTLASKIEGVKQLFSHLTLHFDHDLEQKIRPTLPKCPVTKCGCHTNSMEVMKKHILSHHDFLCQIYKNRHPSFSVQTCFVKRKGSPECIVLEDNDDQENSTDNEPEIQEVTQDSINKSPKVDDANNLIGDPVCKEIFDDFKSFCAKRNCNPSTCESGYLSIFLSGLLKNPKVDEAVLDKFMLFINSIRSKEDKNQSVSENPRIAETLEIVKNKIKARNEERDKEIRLKAAMSCFTCNKNFVLVSHLENHINEKDHDKSEVGCRFCNLSFTVNQEDTFVTIKKKLALHMYSKVHLYNRWLKVHRANSSLSNLSTRIVETDLLSLCEPCFEKVHSLEQHCETKKHKDNMKIIFAFVEHCDYREICPVNCSLTDVSFYLEYMAPLVSEFSLNLHHVVMILSKIHDLIDGSELFSVRLVVDKMTELLMASATKEGKRPFKFICYSCPGGFKTNKELEDHISKIRHKSAVNSREQRGIKNLIKCTTCNLFFGNSDVLKVHLYSKGHLKQLAESKPTKLLGSKNEMTNEDKYCVLCGTIPVSCSKHLSEENHLAYVKIADNYFNFCWQKDVNPVNCDRDVLIEFLSNSDKKKLKFVMNVINKLHSGLLVNGQRGNVATDKTLLKFVENLTEKTSPTTKTEKSLRKRQRIDSDESVDDDRKRKRYDSEESTSSKQSLNRYSKECVTVSDWLREYPEFKKPYPKVVVKKFERWIADNVLMDHKSKQRKRLLSEADELEQPPTKRVLRASKEETEVSTKKSEQLMPTTSKTITSTNKSKTEMKSEAVKDIKAESKVESDIKTNKEEKPSKAKVPGTSLMPSKKEPKQLTKASQKMVFCLDCEQCSGTTCDHSKHGLRLVTNVREHMKSTKHTRYQPVDHILQAKKVHVTDLAFHPRYGNKIRKQFKKLVLAGQLDCVEYQDMKKCIGCQFQTMNVLEFFRHVQEHHLK